MELYIRGTEDALADTERLQTLGIADEDTLFMLRSPPMPCECACDLNDREEMTEVLKTDGTVWRCDGGVFDKVDVTNVVAVARGMQHSAYLQSNGTLLVCGSNHVGQLGLSPRGEWASKPVPMMEDVTAVACGALMTAALKTDGSVWVTGKMLSLAEVTIECTFATPELMTELGTDVLAVACGHAHLAVLKKDRTVWGSFLGRLLEEEYGMFAPMPGSEGAVAVACGQFCTAVLKSDGTVWACGRSKYGELGVPRTGNVRDEHNGRLDVPTLSPILAYGSNVAAMACGANHTIVLKTDGTVWGAGLDYHGQLGLGKVDGKEEWDEENCKVTPPQQIEDLGSDVKYVACGNHCTVAIKTDGTVWVAGSNAHGQLGLGPEPPTSLRATVALYDASDDTETATAVGATATAVGKFERMAIPE